MCSRWTRGSCEGPTVEGDTTFSVKGQPLVSHGPRGWIPLEAEWPVSVGTVITSHSCRVLAILWSGYYRWFFSIFLYFHFPPQIWVNINIGKDRTGFLVNSKSDYTDILRMQHGFKEASQWHLWAITCFLKVALGYIWGCASAKKPHRWPWPALLWRLSHGKAGE